MSSGCRSTTLTRVDSEDWSPKSSGRALSRWAIISAMINRWGRRAAERPVFAAEISFFILYFTLSRICSKW